MLETYVRFAEEVVRADPVFLIGSGLSAGAGISSMGRLAAYLVRHVRTDAFPEADAAEWERVKRRLTAGNMGLEEALQRSEHAWSDTAAQEIVRRTWCRIARDEQKLLPDLSNGGDPTGFVRYFRALGHAHRAAVHIVTTNYDHLAEWSASSAGWGVWDGFGEGAIGLPLSAAELDERVRRAARAGKRTVTTFVPYVRVYKPHGSLSWFRRPDGVIVKMPGVGAPLLPKLAQAGISPAIVTPGTGKYLETHRSPYNGAFADMRSALEQARALVVVGFGFNDLHLEGSFESVWRDESVPKLILARSLSDRAKALIGERRLRHFAAVEKEGAGSRIISDLWAPATAPASGLWTFKALLDAVWGVEADAGTYGLV